MVPARFSNAARFQRSKNGPRQRGARLGRLVRGTCMCRVDGHSVSGFLLLISPLSSDSSASWAGVRGPPFSLGPYRFRRSEASAAALATVTLFGVPRCRPPSRRLALGQPSLEGLAVWHPISIEFRRWSSRQRRQVDYKSVWGIQRAQWACHLAAPLGIDDGGQFSIKRLGLRQAPAMRRVRTACWRVCRKSRPVLATMVFDDWRYDVSHGRGI